MMEGHKKQIAIFKQIIKSERLSHAYIFSGPEGVGKKLFAINLAKSLMCLQGSFFTDCHCNSCKEIDMRTHPDFYLFEKNELNVENMRGISETSAMTPLSGNKKIYILDGVEIFSNTQTVAGNALLKSLEEPGEGTFFFLITSAYDLVMPTIRSRTNQVKFGGLSFLEIKNILSNLRPEEKFLDRIAKKAAGSISKALKILDGNALNVSDYLENSNYTKFAKTFLTLKDKTDIKIILEFAYSKSLEDFKKFDGEYKFFQYGEYMLDILKRLPYNINVDLLKADFLSKTIEVYE